VLAGFLAKVREDGDVSTNERLQSRADRAENRTRSHDNSADKPESFHHAIAV